jgi:hypothetical protein
MTPKIKLDFDCGEAHVNWGKFDELDSLTKADFLKDIVEIFAKKYSDVVDAEDFLHDLIPDDKVYCKLCDRAKPKDTAHSHSGGFVCAECWDERLRTTE